MNRLATLMCGLVLAFTSAGLAQVAKSPLAIGKAAPDFNLMGTDGSMHKLADWNSSPVLAVAFLCNHCTESQVYEARVNKLAAEYASKGVTLVAIQSANPKAYTDEDLAWSDVGETLADMKERASFRKFSFPYLYDGDTGTTAQAFGVTVAPTIFIFDKERKLRYSGLIDNNADESKATIHYAAAAIEALLGGVTVTSPTTSASGCTLRIGSSAVAPASTVAEQPVTVTLATTTALSALRRNPTGKLLLINFYATWCGPCVTEFPDLMATNRMYRSRPFSFTTISSNTPEERPQVLEFLQKMNASTNNLLYGSDDTYAMQDAFDPEVGSAVPVTVLLGAGGDVLYHEQGEIDLMEIRRAILANLPDDAAHIGSQKYWSTP